MGYKPPLIYKYQPVNHYSLANLKNNQIWLSKTDDFNDPFDAIHFFDDGCTETETLKRLASSTHKTIKSIGVSCFCEENDNILMWSHYADNHKGFCLGFNTDNPFFYNLHPVSYTNDLPAITPDMLVNGNNDAKKTLLTKYIKWSHEKEWRLVHLDQCNELLSYDSDALSAVYFGVRMEHVFKEIIYWILKQQNNRIKFFDAGIHDHLFKIDFKEIDI